MGMKIIHFSPGRFLLASFIFVIAVGAALLSLPQARLVDIDFLDILFTATSSTCVTGMIVVPISYFTFFGKCVILALVQIGGLGLITLSFFLISLFLNLGMATKLMAGQILDFEFWGKAKTFLMLIIGLTFSLEILGAIIMYFPFRQMFPAPKAIFYAIFHSVTAFCNAGICLTDNNMINYANEPTILLTLSFLVFTGSIGFIVWYESLKVVKGFIKKLKTGKTTVIGYSLHSKIALITSLGLIVFGTVVFWSIERLNAFKDFTLPNQILNAFFASSTLRSSGFNSVDVSQLALATILIFIILMIIGGSPNSAGGGIKTTTFVVFIATVISMAKGREVVEIGGRTIPINQIYKTIVIIAFAIGWLLLTTFILLLLENNFSFIQMLFEAVCAFSTSGVSTGIPEQLTIYSKIVLMVSMLVGRIGSLALVLSLRKPAKHLYRYPEERIIIG